MNKIVIDNDSKEEKIQISTDTLLKIECNDISTNLEINISPNSSLEVIDTSNNTSQKIKYNLSNNAYLKINKISINACGELQINLNGENAEINISNSLINYNDNIYKEEINHNSENTRSIITNHAVNFLDNTFKFIVDGKIKKNATKTTFRQDNKIMNMKSGKSYILPNLIVDNDDIEASHSAYIGQFDEETIFYLMTRGISFEDANKLLIKAFLINKMEDNIEIKEIIEKLIENI